MSLGQALATTKPDSRIDRSETSDAEIDPRLAFMLAQQATARWQADAARFELAVAHEDDLSTIIAEGEATLAQVSALRERIMPFENYVNMAVRFEAQEVLAALEAVRVRITRVTRRVQTNVPWRDATELLEEMRRRRH